MNTSDNEALEGLVSDYGLDAIVHELALMCRDRGNAAREKHDGESGRLWTHGGAVLFNAAEEVGSTLVKLP